MHMHSHEITHDVTQAPYLAKVFNSPKIKHLNKVLIWYAKSGVLQYYHSMKKWINYLWEILHDLSIPMLQIKNHIETTLVPIYAQKNQTEGKKKIYKNCLKQ
jgi:hypothetical protein